MDMTLLDRLGPDELAQVTGLVDAAAEADGVHPLSEHVVLHLRHGGDDGTRHLLGRSDGAVVAYAHLDTTDTVEGSSAETVVAPQSRGHGHGRAMVQALLAETPDGRLRLWSHGSHPAAAALATGLGFDRTRVLWQMRRSLLSPLPAPVLPAGVTVRTFTPGDEARWLELNNRAFADHPEQGRWTLDDVQHRVSEPWFDPRGFFLAERDGALLAFHWTKVHGGESHGGHSHDPIGEVYVVGVDPAAQGLGLGRAITLQGLCHLRSSKVPQAMLYVDDSNTAAVALYERLGFTRWASDICFAISR